MDMVTSMDMPGLLIAGVILLVVVVRVCFAVVRLIGGRAARRDHPVDPPRWGLTAAMVRTLAP